MNCLLWHERGTMILKIMNAVGPSCTVWYHNFTRHSLLLCCLKLGFNHGNSHYSFCSKLLQDNFVHKECFYGHFPFKTTIICGEKKIPQVVCVKADGAADVS